MPQKTMTNILIKLKNIKSSEHKHWLLENYVEVKNDFIIISEEDATFFRLSHGDAIDEYITIPSDSYLPKTFNNMFDERGYVLFKKEDIQNKYLLLNKARRFSEQVCKDLFLSGGYGDSRNLFLFNREEAESILRKYKIYFQEIELNTSSFPAEGIKLKPLVFVIYDSMTRNVYTK